MAKHSNLTPIDIATGRSRHEIHWKNKETTWSDLVERLSETHRTHETLEEYAKSPKDRQDEIKDIGGFVGGFITGGRRKGDAIMHRSLITLDIDFARPGFWELFELQYDNAGLIYSTHKHTPKAPRLRLVMPLSRPVFPDEYVAIARRIAGDLGINDFDDTTFEPSRLMYWPSTSANGEYEFKVQDGDWIDADAVLETYRDWKDASSWPCSNRVAENIKRNIKKQGDPLEKGGLIGAFCREYTIEQAIAEFLADEYTECDGSDGRYSYNGGSTSGGLVIYDEKYAFSHHGTDPTSGKLCNAFDLVRIHMFGLRDEDAKEGTPSNKLPSFIAMEDFAAAQKPVSKRIGAERLEKIQADFGEFASEAPTKPGEKAPDFDWLGDLERTKKGEALPTIENAMIILRNDRRLAGLFALDAFAKREQATRNMPWRPVCPATKYLKDSDDAGVRHYLQKNYEMSSKTAIQDAMMLIVEENTFHPIKDYLETLKWDGRPRIDTLAIDYLGAEDSIYTRTVMRKLLVAAIARIYNPGAKFDYVLTFVGSQGVGKSTFVRKLGADWYSDSFGNIQGKDAYESIQGVWFMELGELAGLKKAEMETVKHFISKAEDRYRVAYGRRTENFPRQCVFIGTTNNKDFLHDPTGNRRFWPVDVGVMKPTKNLWDEFTKEEVAQVHAEAIELYKTGETCYLDKETENMAMLIQEDHAEQDERTRLVREYLDVNLPMDWESMDIYERRDYLTDAKKQDEDGVKPRKRVCITDIWTECYAKSDKDLDRLRSKELHQIMRSFKDWDSKVYKAGEATVRGYARIKQQKQ